MTKVEARYERPEHVVSFQYEGQAYTAHMVWNAVTPRPDVLTLEIEGGQETEFPNHVERTFTLMSVESDGLKHGHDWVLNATRSK